MRRMPALQTNASPEKIEMIRAFLGRFDGLKQQEEQSLPLLRRFLPRFAAELPNLQEQEQSWRTATAPDFNVFRALRLERRETKLHSRFLAELLDPNGIHGQGDIFLTEFLDVAKATGLRSPSEWPEASYGRRMWEITTEEAVNEYDRLDIVLRCEQAKFIAVIENKIDAAEGDEQLLRYDEWLQEQQRFDFRNLVFLTPDGREPKTISTDKCLCLSYREHVTACLRKMFNGIKAPHLRFAIDQYVQILDSL
jgi:hypothetical protein